MAGTESGQPAASTALRPTFRRLLADLRHAAPDDVVDQRRVEPDPVGQGPQHDRAEVDRVGAGEGSPAPADRRPDRLDDHGIAHALISPTR